MHLAVEMVGDADQELVELAGLLADRDHLHGERREDARAGERLRHPRPLAHADLDLAERARDHLVARDLLHDAERLQHGDAALEQRAEGTREARDLHLAQQRSHQREAELPLIPLVAPARSADRVAHAAHDQAHGTDPGPPGATSGRKGRNSWWSAGSASVARLRARGRPEDTGE